MKITMYELLGLVKDDKAPKKIKYQNYIYEYQLRRDTENSFNYMCNENGVYLSRKYFIDNILNDEVEILEEEPYVEVCGSWFTKSEYDEFIKGEEEKKIPEKIKLYTLSDNDSADFTTLQDFNNRDIQRTINWILDYLKSKGE